jgi:hypothetical protein
VLYKIDRDTSKLLEANKYLIEGIVTLVKISKPKKNRVFLDHVVLHKSLGHIFAVYPRAKMLYNHLLINFYFIF